MPTEGKEPVREPKLIHYNLFSKPWCYDNIQYEEYYWQCAQNSGYLAVILDYKSRYGEENRESDRKSLERMISRAEEIAEAKENFRTVFNEGKERRL